jgi:hypothetical protein
MDNIPLVLELLEEMIDFGFPQSSADLNLGDTTSLQRSCKDVCGRGLVSSHKLFSFYFGINA